MLGRLPESSRYEAQRTALSDADAEVREAALRSVVTTGRATCFPRSRELLTDPVAEVRLAAATEAIGELGGETDPAPIVDRRPRPEGSGAGSLVGQRDDPDVISTRCWRR